MKIYGAAVLAALVAPMKGNAFSNTPISHGTMATNLPMYTNHRSNYPISKQKRRLAFIRLFSTANDNDTRSSGSPFTSRAISEAWGS